MRPVSHTLITQVGAPIEKVFEALTDPARFPAWLPGCSAAEATGPLKQGGRLRVQFQAGREALFEVVDYRAPYTFGWVEREGRTGAKVFFRLDFQGGSTAVTMKELSAPPGLLGWVKGKFGDRRLGRMQLERAVQGLRASVAMEAPGA